MAIIDNKNTARKPYGNNEKIVITDTESKL